jgi:hypothetical protein
MENARPDVIVGVPEMAFVDDKVPLTNWKIEVPSDWTHRWYHVFAERVVPDETATAAPFQYAKPKTPAELTCIIQLFAVPVGFMTPMMFDVPWVKDGKLNHPSRVRGVVFQFWLKLGFMEVRYEEDEPGTKMDPSRAFVKGLKGD